MKQYLHFVANRRKPIDGLFLSLMVHALKQHVNILYMGRIWTSQRSDITVLTDATIILVLGCYLSTKKMTWEEIKKSDPDYITPLHDPRASFEFVSMPKVLNEPVHNIAARMDEIGLAVIQENTPLQALFAGMLECETKEYCHQISMWIHDFAPDLPIISSWLVIRGLDLEEYIAMLQQDRDSDGLELWCASIVLNKPLNVVFELSVWSTALELFDTAYPSIVLTTHCSGVLCELAPDSAEEDDLSNLGAAASKAPGKHQGRPVVDIPEYPKKPDSDHSDTDPDDMIEAEARV